MSQHTPEPWTENEKADGTRRRIVHADAGVAICVVPHQANATRIVAAVNGCAGLNPAAFREVVEALKSYVAEAERERVYPSENCPMLTAAKQALAHAEQQP